MRRQREVGIKRGERESIQEYVFGDELNYTAKSKREKRKISKFIETYFTCTKKEKMFGTFDKISYR